MLAVKLLRKAEAHFARHGFHPKKTDITNVFTRGAEWMAAHLKIIKDPELKFSADKPYELYGWGKYVLCTLCALVFLVTLREWWYIALPGSVIVFYFFETQLLFLFPYLIDRKENAIGRSIQLAWRIGPHITIFNVIPIAWYMLTGGNFKRSIKESWLIGCLAILFWYEQEA